ncbi:hypothetical protein [Fictibacillus enclensis]|uniref:hypothetical protein n=1 Tax=Fictibacillus enclensis TaxID=1017270 RepID=UPI0024C03CD1|nr:hypothetical protein [Fictibacillus enclensis]WHY71875.1 hypothetical protein QNH15_23255 [Fictibacillus enclensis]
MKKYVILFAVLFVLSLGVNIYLYVQKENAETQVLKDQVHALRVITQNTIVGVIENNKVLLKQTLANLQSNKPFRRDDDFATGDVISKYEHLIKDAAFDKDPPAGLHAKLSKVFRVLVPLQASRHLKEEQIHRAMKKINRILGD